MTQTSLNEYLCIYVYYIGCIISLAGYSKEFQVEKVFFFSAAACILFAFAACFGATSLEREARSLWGGGWRKREEGRKEERVRRAGSGGKGPEEK